MEGSESPMDQLRLEDVNMFEERRPEDCLCYQSLLDMRGKKWLEMWYSACWKRVFQLGTAVQG
jgi:hypothetical protein